MSDSLWSHGLYSPWSSPGQSTGVSCLSILQGIFATQGWNAGIPHYRQIFYQPSQKGSPRILEWVAYPFSRGSSWPRNQTGVSCNAGGFFTNWVMSEAQEMETTYVIKKISKTHKNIHALEYYSALTGRYWHLQNMDESGGHYTEGNQAVTERKKLHDLTYIWNLKCGVFKS